MGGATDFAEKFFLYSHVEFHGGFLSLSFSYSLSLLALTLTHVEISKGEEYVQPLKGKYCANYRENSRRVHWTRRAN